MVNETKIKQKERQRTKTVKKKQPQVIPKKEPKKVQKISAKYLNEELQVEKSINEHLKNQPIEETYEKEKKAEVDFFCDPYSNVQLTLDKAKSSESEEKDEEIEAHSTHSNESSPNTHMASTYIGPEHEEVVKKFELTRISYDEIKLLFYPKDERVFRALKNDEERNISKNNLDDGIYVHDAPLIKNISNKFLLLNRIHESGSTEFLDLNGDLRNFEKLIDDDVYRLCCEKTFTPIYVPPQPMNFEPIDKIISEKKFLKILIGTLKFDQHKLFSSENTLARTVEKLHAEFERRRNLNGVETLRKKLINLRELREENFPTVQNDQKSGKSMKNEEVSLIQQIKSSRLKLHVEEQYHHKIITCLLENWKSLKSIRKQQNYANTKISLKIQKINSDDISMKQAQRQQEYDAELNEMIAEEFEKYNSAKVKYKEFLKNTNDPDKIIHEQEQNVKKPKKPDIDKIVSELNEIYDKIPINDPELKIILLYNESVDEKLTTKPKEKLKKFNRISYRIELDVDGETVGSTKQSRLNEDFSISIQSAFILKLTKHLPEKIKLMVYEVKSTTWKLTEILLPLPEDDENFCDADEINCNFSSKRLQRRHSRTKFSATLRRNNSSRKLINTTGNLSVKIGWTNNHDDEGAENQKFVKIKETKGNDDLLSQTTLQKWFDQKLLNPLDPDAQNLVQLISENNHEIQKIIKNEEKETELFRFNEDELAFMTEEEFNSIERFHLLRARYNSELSYKNRKLIPQTDRELELDKDKDINIIDETLIADPIDLQRYKGRKYLRKVYDIIENHCENLNRDKMNTNILIGDDFPTFASLSLAFLEMFGPKRPLKPVRRATSSRASCKINEVSSFNVVVNVVRAINVPIRSEEPTSSSSRKSSTFSGAPGTSKFAPFRHTNIHPHIFVAISLKDHHHTCRTSSAEGTNPMWNEQLVLPLNVNSDDTKRCLSIDLYDEVVEDLIDNVAEVYQRITCKWLGSLKIPIINICSNQRIEGTFELSVPSILLGYTKAKFSPADLGHHQTSIAIENMPDLSRKTFINLFISLEPNVEVPELISSGLECIEVIHVEQHIKLWFEQLKLEFPARTQKWNPLVTLLSGKRACITRLLNPLSFPFEKNETTSQLLRRFISLIPIQNDASTSHGSCTGLNGVWLSNHHVLGLMTSSSKDLGVLLTCFYLELGCPAWLILGSSTTCGESCFVLIKESNEFYIVDPRSGRKYSSKDIYCPLVKCYCLVNQYNVWANVQREQRVFITQFDVNRSFDWRPLFTKVVDIPSGTVHDTSFKFERSLDTRDLQITIQAKIIKKINSWRSHKKTVWNRFVSENLKTFLIKLEDDICFENDSDEHAEMLKALHINHKVIGYSLNCKYTNLSSIVTEIKNTGIHLNLDSKVEFALNVYIKEYANNVLSIWILLMSLVPKS